MTHRYTQMDPQDALYNAARSYPGSVEALAHRMGMSPAVLRNKLSPNVKTHHVTLSEASSIVEFLREAKCDDALMPLQALNWQHGLVALPMPDVSHLSDEELAQAVLRVMKENGDVANVLQSSLADGEITTQELDAIEHEVQEAMASLAHLLERARAKHNAKPSLRVA
jgi:hypothetical protein